MKAIVKCLSIAMLVTVLAGCARTAPVDNIQTVARGSHSALQVKTAILKAGLERDWVMTEAGPGVINGRLLQRGHSVDIRIPYTSTGYSINYVGSTNLKAADGKIHKSYNRWVHNLDKNIQLNLAASGL
ncbi:hypothetical protein CIG19_09785 [Enterobacterales bacterium CwR94]|nr:hypothetical protein CIG19_09785 [Enterobacterales bacterium CwR94]